MAIELRVGEACKAAGRLGNAVVASDDPTSWHKKEPSGIRLALWEIVRLSDLSF